MTRWEFEKVRKALTVNPQGPVTFDDPGLVIRAVLNGVVIGTAIEETFTELIADERLVQVRGLVSNIPLLFPLLSKPSKSVCCSCRLIKTLQLFE